MNIAIISINDFRFHPNMRLQQAARACGHEVFLINPHEMAGMVKNNSFDFTIKGTIPEPHTLKHRFILGLDHEPLQGGKGTAGQEFKIA